MCDPGICNSFADSVIFTLFISWYFFLYMFEFYSPSIILAKGTEIKMSKHLCTFPAFVQLYFIWFCCFLFIVVCLFGCDALVVTLW